MVCAETSSQLPSLLPAREMDCVQPEECLVEEMLKVRHVRMTKVHQLAHNVPSQCIAPPADLRYDNAQ